MADTGSLLAAASPSSVFAHADVPTNKAQHNITVDKKKILLDGPMKQTGTFSVDVKLYPEVSGKLTVEISAE